MMFQSESKTIDAGLGPDTYALVIDDFYYGSKFTGIGSHDKEYHPANFYQSPLGSFDVDISHCGAVYNCKWLEVCFASPQYR